MSEAERKKRQDYKRNRLKWIIIQSIAIALIAAIAAWGLLVYNNMNRTYYIHYTEHGDVDYKVHYKENNFFEDEWIESDRAYIVSLIDNILADFKYDLKMDTESVGFDYKYSIGAQVQVLDKTSGAPLFSPSYELVPEKTAAVTGDSIRIKEKVNIDFVEYNRVAKTFTDTYGIKGANSSLLVTLNVNVLGNCDEFESSSENSYFVSLKIPLNLETVDAQITSSISEDETKVIACSQAASKNIFLAIGIVSSIIALILGCILATFIFVTRNEDINYTRKVKKTVSAYRSFIQQIEGEFDVGGYQEIYIKSFEELLGIRDTIQSPVLMSENIDQTCTRFLIPTATRLLYVYEIKVDNYDELYSLAHTEAEEAVY